MIRRSEMARRLKEMEKDSSLKERFDVLGYIQSGLFHSSGGIVMWDTSNCPPELWDQDTLAVVFVPQHLTETYSYILGFIPSDVTRAEVRVNGLVWRYKEILENGGMLLWAQN